ncbi:hypothetical protein D3C85_567740 [compost metagenome]
MKVYFSPAKLSFFPDEFKKDYEKSGTWPLDAVEVSLEVFKEFALSSTPLDKVLGVVQGIPAWVDRVSTPNASAERSWRNSELARADVELYKVQDSDPKSVGTVTAWREYRRLLRAYPESEGFPSAGIRPTAPDAV